MRLARRRRTWLKLPLPERRGDVTVAEVMAAAPGTEGEAMIRAWCASVWEAWQGNRAQVLALVERELGMGP